MQKPETLETVEREVLFIQRKICLLDYISNSTEIIKLNYPK